MNVHLGREENRKVFVGMVSMVGLDVCVVTETWFREGEGDRQMGKTLEESNYLWFGRDRKNQRSWAGDGGVGILIKKGTGVCRVVRESRENDMFWVELKIGDINWYIGAVYMCPEGSSRNNDVSGHLQELEKDILDFKKKGIVVCLGDFNSRIGCLESAIRSGEEQVLIPRRSQDRKLQPSLLERGRQFVDSMNACSMIILNGIENEAEFTFESVSNKGRSVVDLIAVEQSVFQGERKLENEKISGVWYVQNSLKVWKEELTRIGDHKLVTCEFQVDAGDEKEVLGRSQSDSEHSREEERDLGWRRRDAGDRKFWKALEEAGEEYMKVWLKEWYEGGEMKEVKSAIFGDDILEGYKKYLDMALLKGVGRKVRKRKGQSKILIWNQDVFEKAEAEKKAYKEWRECKSDEKLQEFRRAKKARKAAVRKHERQMDKKVVSKIEKMRSQDPREYWRQLKALSTVQSKKKSLPEQMRDEDGVLVTDRKAVEEVWARAFEKLGKEDKSSGGAFDEVFAEQVKEEVQRAARNPQEDLVTSLDQPLQRAEVDRAIKRLRRGKAVGIDQYMNEIFMYGGERIVEATWKLCAEVFTSETYPKDWARGLIFPIFKGGDEEAKRNPLKYRGITLLSVLGKIYVSVLTERVTTWAESSGILAEEQAGFRKDRSTSDQLFLMMEFIRNRRPAKTYCCFLDVQKAYDRVWRDGLWYKLRQYGVKGKMWRVLRSVYESVESSVLVNDQRTRFFRVDVGLRQGCLMSPILFALYINGLAEEIKKENIGVRIRTRREERCGILMFADDIVLIGEDRRSLEKLMEITYQYSRLWRFSFNYDKCAVVVFDNKKMPVPKYGKCEVDCSCGFHWKLGERLIKQERSYKYLGMELDTQLTQAEFRDRIYLKARANISKVWSMGMSNGSLSVKASINLYEALVRSVVEYGAEVWKEINWEDGERIQREMGRRILRCHGKTPNEAVLGELGWWRLKTRREFLKLKYWIRLSLMDEARLVRQVYLASKDKYLTRRRTNWCSEIHKLVVKYGLQDIWLNEDLIKHPMSLDANQRTVPRVKKYWEGVLFEKVQKVEEEEWRKMACRKKKLRTYITFKKKLEFESYLLSEKDKFGRYLLTGLRSGTNKLRIETGRWKRPIEKEHERLCLQCHNGEIEDERHFLLRCSRFQDLRKEMFDNIRLKTGLDLDTKSQEIQWQKLMASETKPGQRNASLKKFVRKALKERDK